MATSEPAVNITINIDKNGTTTLATAGCICKRDIDINVDVPTTGGGERSDFIPDEALVFSGACTRTFASNKFNWLIDKYGDLMTTENLAETDNMFYFASTLTKIPFDFNYNESELSNTYGHKTANNMFYYCQKLEEIGDFYNFFPSSTQKMFNYCHNLRYLPNFINAKWDRIQTYAYSNISEMFNGCCSLRSIPEDFLKELWGIMTSYSNTVMNGGFASCYALDEIRGLNPQTGTLTTNAFGNAFSNCSRVKDIIFATQEDGTPYVCNWKNQTIDLSNYVGYFGNTANLYNYNSGITENTRVVDIITYNDFKDDPDWWTSDVAFSRYNHDSLVRTIQSLPDTSAYLATQTSGTNTLKIRGDLGRETDGGATGTLTAEEIAVATAKGWTITFTTDTYGGVLPS